MVDLLNKTWRPTLALVILLATISIYVIYPVFFPLLKLMGYSIKMPLTVFDNFNILLTTGGILAAIRTVEKTMNVVEEKMGDYVPYLRILEKINKSWRPLLAYAVVVSCFIAYVLLPYVASLVGKDVIPPYYYEHLNALLLTGGVLAGLRAVEKKMNIDTVH